MLSLQDMCIMKYVPVLCNHENLKITILNNSELVLNTFEDFNKWIYRVENDSLYVVEEFETRCGIIIPEDLIIIIGIQMLKWVRFHHEEFGLSIAYAQSFLKANHFLENGFIDREIAAWELVKDIKVSTIVRFRVAVFYFFIDEIVHLWEQLSDYEKKECLEKNINNEYLTDCYYFVKGIENHSEVIENLQNFFYFIFELSIDCGREVAMKHCWYWLDISYGDYLAEYAIRSLIQSVLYSKSVLPENMACHPEIFTYFEPYVEILDFLYHELEMEQFRQYFYYPFEIEQVLEYILHWPHQHLFINIADLFWGILTEGSFYYLLHRIVYKMSNSIVWSSYSYKLLFRKFWVRSPRHYKSYVYRMERNNGNDDDNDYFHDYNYLISSLFRIDELTDFDVETLKMILVNCTHDEKEGIVREQGIYVCQWVLARGYFKLVDLFINSCVSEDKSRYFKKNLLSTTNFRYILWKLVSEKKFELVKKISDWALLDSEETESFKQNLLNILTFKEVVDYFFVKPSIGKDIDTFLNSILSPDEIVEFKKNFRFDMDNFIEIFKFSLQHCEFEIIDAFLQWKFPTEIQISNFKFYLAFVLNDYNFFHSENDFDHVNKFIDWSKMNKFDRKMFKCDIAFSSSTLIYYTHLVGDCKFKPIDKFIKWSEMSDTDIEIFKQQLFGIFSSTRASSYFRTTHYYSTLIVCGKDKEVDFALKWSQLSGNYLKKFRRRIRKFCEEYTFGKNFDIKNSETQDEIVSIIKWCRSSEEDLKRIKNKIIIVLRNTLLSSCNPDNLHENLDFVDIFLKYCELSEKEIKDYKMSLLISHKGIRFMHKLIKRKRWNEIDSISDWLGQTREEIRQLKRKFFQVSYNICLQLAIRGRYRDLNVFLSWIEIDGLKNIWMVKESCICSRNVYRIIYKISKYNTQVRKKFIKSLRISNGIKEYQKTFLALAYLLLKA